MNLLGFHSAAGGHPSPVATPSCADSHAGRSKRTKVQIAIAFNESLLRAGHLSLRHLRLFLLPCRHFLQLDMTQEPISL